MGRLGNLALNPWVILISLAGGFGLGIRAPEFSLQIAFVGHLYLDLMKMVVLPFMMSAVMLSVQRLMQEGGAGRFLGRVLLVFGLLSVTAAVVGTAAMLTLEPGAHLPRQTLDAFGVIVSGDTGSTDTPMALNGDDPEPRHLNLEQVLATLVPSNIFAALVNDDTLKVLVFSLLFGLAIGQVQKGSADGLSRTLGAVSQGCQRLMQWMNYLLPIVLLCTSAGQIAKTGVEPMFAMSEFVAAFAAAAALILILAVWIIWARASLTLGETIGALRGPFSLAIATRNSAICMPIMIESLADRLGIPRGRVELLVPLSVSLLRIGPVVYYACATLFIAQLYGLRLDGGDIALVVGASVLAGFASAGMTGLAIVSLTGMTCGYLGLPFEAAFVLFLAVDPLCDILRTLVIVLGNMAAVALICPRAPAAEEEPCPV